jgi:hypothetical protein
MIDSKYSHLKFKILEDEYEYILFENSSQLDRAVSWLNENEVDYSSFSFKGEKSLVCRKSSPNFPHIKAESGWTAFKIVGDMPFGTVQGLIASISSLLYGEKIGVCVVSSFLSDVFFVRTKNISKVQGILEIEGWSFCE